MIRSMTGFGRAEHSENGICVTAEVQSVNGRFLDIKVKIPKELEGYESEIRKIVQSYIERGRISVLIAIDRGTLSSEGITIDFAIVEKYVHLAKELSERYSIENNIDTRTLLSMPNVISWKEENTNPEPVWEMAKKTVISAFEAHRSMREDEGVAMENDLTTRLRTVEDYVKEIRQRSPEIIKTGLEKFRSRIESLIGSDAVNETRFSTEVAIYADRLDVTEECVRLTSHIDQFSKELSQNRASGRKLIFLLQEMGREVNTIGSKAMDAPIAQTVVSIKNELEKIREQTENME